LVTKKLPFLNYIETLLIDRKNMRENDMLEKDEIFSKVLRAGRRTYFFDVRATKADDYYITITESKKFTEEDGSFHFKKHKIYLYKEDFAASKKNTNKKLLKKKQLLKKVSPILILTIFNKITKAQN